MGYQQLNFPGFNVTGETGVTGYRGVSLTSPREFGVNVRYNF